MTFLELCQRLRREVGAAGSGPATVTGQNGEYLRLIGWIAQAWQEIQAERRDWRFAWSETEIEVSPEFRDYPVPDDFEHWIPETLRIGINQLRPMEYSDFRARYREPSNASAPSVITLLPDNRIRLDTSPPATSLLAFEYFRTPQVLTENGDVPRLPERYHMLIVYRAMIQYGLFENAPEVVQQGGANASRLMSDMLISELPSMEIGGALA
ncbi:phage adaptor protein [Halomonas sp. WWR20]